MRTESLTRDMISNGYDDFDIIVNNNNNNISDYDKYYTRKSREIVRNYYKLDFEIFGYTK